MKLTWRVLEVPTARAFKIATGAQTSARVVIAELAHDGHVGYGEAAPSQRVTGETVESVGHFLDWAAGEVADKRPAQWEALLDHVHDDICGNPAARAALDLAVHDLVGKVVGVPARRLYGLPEARLETCMTVSLDAPDAMAAEARDYRARGFQALKLKLGDAAGDLARVQAVREAVPDARLRADANTGWTVDDALRLLPAMDALGIEFLEQPVPPQDVEGLVAIAKRSPVTVYADESVMDAHDVARLHAAGFCGGVNLKVMKAGGLRPVVKAARLAKERRYAVQLGCMVETAVGISGATQLLALLDHADLDGHLLLAEQPFLGAWPEGGVYETTDLPGLGVRPA